MKIPRGGSPTTRLILRKESNFGCAICGEPYLTYHHFDPTWAEKPHDNPEGIIALCAKHANAADGGAFTKEQLRNWKTNPFLKGRSPSAYFEWTRHNFLFIVGGNIAYNCVTVLEGRKDRVIWLEEDKSTGIKTISLDLKNSSGHNFLKMNKNQWETNIATAYDIDSSTRGQKLKVIAKEQDSWFEIKFRSMNFIQVEKIIRSMFSYKDIIREVFLHITSNFSDPLSVCFLTGKFYLPEEILFKDTEIIYNTNRFGSNFAGNSKVAYKFS